MRFVLLTCLIVYVVNGIPVQTTTVPLEGYYWRDYIGTIPSDALVGGKDNVGNPIYVGQTIYPKVGVMVPGKISSTTKKMYFEFDRTEHPVTDDVKILCSVHPQQFQWIETHGNQNVASVVNGSKQLIIGGHDRPHPVTIGRRFGEDGINVGKVLVINNAFEAIHLTKNGNGWQENNFEVLVYDPSHTSDESTHLDSYSSSKAESNCVVNVTVE